MTLHAARPFMALMLSLVVAACGQGQSSAGAPATAAGPTGVASGTFARTPPPGPKGYSGTITAVEDWHNPAEGFAGPDWKKGNLTIKVQLMPRAGSTGTTGWYDDNGSTFEYDGSAHYQETGICPRNDDRTYAGSGLFGTEDNQISLFLDPANGGVLHVRVMFTVTQTNANCDKTVKGSAPDGWQPSCGDTAADAAAAGRIFGKLNASDGSIDFTCTGPMITDVGAGTVTISGSLTRP
jgi:hypothetical protein